MKAKHNMKGYKLWKLRYSYKVETIDQLPYRQTVQYLMVAGTQEEALKKADKHFVSLDQAMNKELLARDKATGGGAILTGLQRLAEAYDEPIHKPKLTLESDSRRFILEPIINGTRLEYLVTKLR